MTELMKRYWNETGKDAITFSNMATHFTDDYVAWLELQNLLLKLQLTWRQVSEKPEKDELIVIKYANGHIPSVLLYGGSTPWESIVELYGISGWFPIPPAPEGE